MGMARLRFVPEDVGTHSLCSGRAMAMHIANVPDQTLVAIGRWRSLGSSDRGLVAKWEGEVISEVDEATLGERVKSG